MGFPIIIVVIILVVIIMLTLGTTYFLQRRKNRKNRTAVGAQDEETVLEKSIATPSSSSIQLKQSDNDQTKTNPNILLDSPPFDSTSSDIRPISQAQQRPTQLSIPKLNVPVTPPNAAFFSDKMELDDSEGNALYLSYMNSPTELSDEKPFLSSAAANIQQKAATLRLTLRQSLSRKSASKSSSNTPISQFFDQASLKSPISPRCSAPYQPEGSVHMSRQSSSTSSRFNRNRGSLQMPSSLLLPPSPMPESPSSALDSPSRFNRRRSLVMAVTTRSLKEYQSDQSSSKIMIDTLPDDSYFSLPMTPMTPSSPYIKTKPVESDEEPPSPQESESPQELNSPQELASAARKVIRSASRKSRRRSVVLNDETAQAMFPLLMQEEQKKELAEEGRTWMSSTLSGSATVSGKRAQKPAHPLIQNVVSNTPATIGRHFNASNFSEKQPVPLERLPHSSVRKVGTHVDTIRKMLQSSWSDHTMKESESIQSLAVSPVGSINPRRQNQQLMSLTLKTGRSRPSMPIGFMEGPTPTISFSSSTVRTMIPTEELDDSNGSSQLSFNQNKTPAQKERENYLKSLE